MILTFYSSDGTTQLGNKEVFNGGGPATDSLDFVTLPAGTYFVKVQPFSTNEFADYTLSISVTAVIYLLHLLISTEPCAITRHYLTGYS